MVDSTNPARKALWVGLAVLAVVALAFFLRSYWNLEVAHPDEATFVLSGGSDPYYHKRAIDCIVFGDVNGFCAGNQAWQHFLKDPLLNYPLGSINPNPPLYQWSVALFGAALAPLMGGDLVAALWWATIVSPAVWGALTVLPIYFLGAALWGRKTGLIAGFFWAVGTTAIDHSALGDADHDAILMFFAATAMYFYVMMLRVFRSSETWVTSWSDGAAIRTGFTRLLRERTVGFGYAGLSGMSIAAVALIWKGFPYLLGILLIFGGLMLLVDNWRNRDSLGLFLGTTLVFALALGVSYPYYATANLMAANFYAPLSMLVAWLVAAAILVPTRDLPFILILPASIVAGVLGAVAIFFLSPVAWRSLFNATVYFRQSQLYQTIAEAHPADFNTMVFGVGPVIFLLSVVGILWLGWRVWKDGRRPYVFMLVWAVIALYMAQSAVRFLFNAVPILALVAAAFTARILDWVNFAGIRREFAGAGSFWGGLRRGVRVSHVVTAFLMATLLVVPQVTLAFDAAVPFNVESRWQRERLENWLVANGYNQTTVDSMPLEGQGGLREAYTTKRLEQEDLDDSAENRQTIGREFVFFVERRLGAFGQGFLEPSWQRGLAFLDKYSSENWSGPVTGRPAFLSWWDYGHWAIAVGKHPAVADNFQNGYQFAANFLLAQNETHAIQLLASRLLVCVPQCGAAIPAAQLTVVRNALPSATDQTVADLLAWKYVPMTDEEAVRLVAAVEDSTQKRIRYFTVDGRMMPLDDPQTPQRVDRASIYYAPVVLKNEQPDRYLETRYTVSGCGLGEVNDTLLRECLKDPARSANVQVTGEKLVYRQPFVNSMFYRAFIGTPVGASGEIPAQQVLQSFYTAQPGLNLRHFRAIYADADVRILEFYPGVNLTGRVVDDDGNGVANAVVRVFDDLNGQSPGVGHGEARTRADGSYSILAPFSTGPGTLVEVTKDNVKVANRTVQVPHASAKVLTGGQYTGQVVPDLLVAKGTVKGRVFLDVNQNGTREANETYLSGFTFKMGNRTVTTDSAGNYTVTTLAGEAGVSTTNESYLFRVGSRVRVDPSRTTTQDLSVVYRPVNLTGRVSMEDQPDKNFTVPVPGLRFEPDPAVSGNTARASQASVSPNGTYTVSLAPGAYLVKVSPSPYIFRESLDDAGRRYELVGATVTLPVAGGSVVRNFVLTVAP